MTDDVRVRFGGDTRDLDNATKRAKGDIASLRPTITGLGGVLGQLKQQITSAFNMPNLGAAKSAVNGVGLEFKGVGAAAEAAAVKVGAVGLAVAAVGVAVVAVSAAMVGMAMKFGKEMGEKAERIGQLAQKLNLTASEVGRWSAVANAAGMSTESWASSMTKLERAQVMAANGSKQQSAAFRELGIEAKNVKDQNELMLQVADKFSKMEDGPKKVQLAMMLMGRAGAEMIPILNQGSEALKEQMALAESYGAVLSDDLVAAGQRVDDAFDEMDMGMQGLKNTMFEALAPSIQVVTEYFNGLIKEMIESYRAGGMVRTIVDVIVVGFKIMITVIMSVIEAFKQLYHAAMTLLTPIVGTLSAVTQGVSMAISGDWSGALSRFKDHMGNVASNTVGHMKAMKNSAQDFGKTLGKLWSEKGLGIPRMRPKGSGDYEIPGLVGGGGGSKGKKSKTDDKEIQAALEALEFKKEIARDDFAEQMRLEDQKLAMIKAHYGENSREYQRALQEQFRMKRDHDQEIVQLERDKIKLQQDLSRGQVDTAREVLDQKLAAERQAIEFSASNGQISEQKKVAMLNRVLAEEQQLERDSAQKIYAIQKAGFEAEIALQNLRPDARRKVLDDMARAEADFNNKMQILSARQNTQTAAAAQAAAQATINKWRGIVSPIQNAFGQMFQSLYMRQASFKQAMITAIDSIVMHWMQKGLEWVANWASMQLAGKAASQAANAGEVAAHTATETAKTGVTAGAIATRQTMEVTAATATAIQGAISRVAEVMGLAAVGAAAAFASTAAIPIVGPALAPGAAAAAYASIAALAPLASAAGGWDRVPADGVRTELHKDEMVLSSKFANPLRDMLLAPSRGVGRAAGAGASVGASGRQFMTDNSQGDTHLHYGPSYPGEGREMGMDEMLRRDGDRLLRRIKQWKRDKKF